MQNISESSWPTFVPESLTRARYLPVVVLVLVAALVYVGGLPNGFVAEDFPSVLDSKVTFAENWNYIVNSVRIRPMVYWFQWAMTQLFDMNPVGSHVFLLLGHVLTTVLLYYVAAKITRRPALGFLSALLFTLYPRNHQAVLWFSANQFTMLGVLSLLTLYCFTEYLTNKRAAWLAASTIAFTFLLITHESAAVFVGLLGLLEVFVYPEPKGWRRLLQPRLYLKYIPFLIVLVIYFAISFSGARSFKLTGELETDTLEQLVSVGGAGETYRFTGLGVTQVKDFMSYITYMVFPHIPLRSLEATDPLSLALTAAAALILLAMFIKGNALVRYGIVWAIVLLLPVIIFVPFGNADRYFYWPVIGFAISVTVLLDSILKWASARKLQFVAPVIAGAVTLYVLASIVFIQMRIGDWQRAGEIAEDLVTQAVSLYPEPVPDSAFLFVDIPSEYEQAYVFLGSGIGSAVLLAYGETDRSSNMDIYQTRDPVLIDTVRGAQPVENPLEDVYVLYYEDGVLYDKSDSFDDIEELRPGSWVR